MDVYAKVRHQVRHWLLTLACTNSFDSAKRKAAPEEVPARVPALKLFIVKCYVEAMTGITFQMNIERRQNVSSNTGIRQGHGLATALFCLLTEPILSNVRNQLEALEAEVMTYLDDVTMAMRDLATDTLKVIPYLIEELPYNSINISYSQYKGGILAKTHL